MKKLDRIMAAVMTVTGAAFLVNLIWQLWDRHARPEFYEVQSAPWYLSIEIDALIAAALIAVEMFIYVVFKKVAEAKEKSGEAKKKK